LLVEGSRAATSLAIALTSPYAKETSATNPRTETSARNLSLRILRRFGVWLRRRNSTQRSILASRYAPAALNWTSPVGASVPPAGSMVTATVAPSGIVRVRAKDVCSPPPAKTPAGFGVPPSITQAS
jgi:hypothetical protein